MTAIELLVLSFNTLNLDNVTNAEEELLDTSTNTTTFIPAHSIFKVSIRSGTSFY